MPIYEYKCSECGSHFEKIQKATDEPMKTCEKCGGEVSKQWSLSGFQFKGEGWYVTDYTRKGNGAKASDEKSAGAESTASSEDASKPATDKPADSGKKEPAAD